MKKLLFVFVALLVCSMIYSQRVSYDGTLNAGASDTVSYELGTPNDNFFGGWWSYQLNYKQFDDSDATLGLYYSNEHPDSATYVLLFFDANADGTNDNPFTLSDDTNGDFMKHGEFFPGHYFIRVLTRTSVADSLPAYEYIRKQ